MKYLNVAVYKTKIKTFMIQLLWFGCLQTLFEMLLCHRGSFKFSFLMKFVNTILAFCCSNWFLFTLRWVLLGSFNVIPILVYSSSSVRWFPQVFIDVVKYHLLSAAHSQAQPFFQHSFLVNLRLQNSFSFDGFVRCQFNRHINTHTYAWSLIYQSISTFQT